jgi:hypothetical protein
VERKSTWPHLRADWNEYALIRGAPHTFSVFGADGAAVCLTDNLTERCTETLLKRNHHILWYERAYSVINNKY